MKRHRHLVGVDVVPGLPCPLLMAGGGGGWWWWTRERPPPPTLAPFLATQTALRTADQPGKANSYPQLDKGLWWAGHCDNNTTELNATYRFRCELEDGQHTGYTVEYGPISNGPWNRPAIRVGLPGTSPCGSGKLLVERKRGAGEFIDITSAVTTLDYKPYDGKAPEFLDAPITC